MNLRELGLMRFLAFYPVLQSAVLEASLFEGFPLEMSVDFYLK